MESNEIEDSPVSEPEAINLSKEMSDIDLQVQAQEHIYQQTLVKEKSKAGRHSLDEVGRSLNAIAQRRRQYFLEYKNCNTIRYVRQWYAWETKRNLETNATDARVENAATRGIKIFLHRIDYYGTLLARFEEYVLQPLRTHYATDNAENPDLEEIKEQMNHFKKKCQQMLTDSTEIKLENVNHSDAEKRFPVISILPRVHEILNKMVSLSFQWRLHARYEQQFEKIAGKRTFTETEKDLNEKRRLLRSMDHQMRKTRRGLELLEEEMAERKQAIATSTFAEEYEQCTERIEVIKHEFEMCKANIESTDSTIKTVQQSFGKYKIVGAKKKKKLESSILKRTRKVEDLARIKAELDRLEDHKRKLDDEEISWLRGGYENAVNVIETVREQSQLLQDNLNQLEKQRNDLKASYEQSMEEVFRLGNEYELLTHKYEYVRRLASIFMKSMANTADQHIVVKPNKISFTKAQSEDAYVMIQPKGVAMVIHNDWSTAKSPNPPKNKQLYPLGTVQKPTKDVKNDFGKALDILCVQCGYYVIHRVNLNVDALRQHMVGLSDQYHGYHGDHNSLMVVVVAKSNEKGDIVDKNGDVVPISDMLDHFAPSRCPALIGKPKVFIFFLKVTVREPVLPMVSETKSSKRSNMLSVETELPVYFEPEPVPVEDDCLVTRVMYEDESALANGPTFGGVTSADEGIPWFATTFLKVLSDQAGSKDILTILRNIKRNYYDHHLTARSTVTNISEKDSISSSFTMVSRKSTEREGHVNIFIDHALRKKLYIMPGI